MTIKNSEDRFNKTLQFLNKSNISGLHILDLGTSNTLSDFLKHNGFNITNTTGEDLDLDFSTVTKDDYDVVTAFEIFEHMFCPFHLLRAIKAEKLIASVPLKLWFADAYWNDLDDRDKHYHEFEVKQFDFLLKKAGWKIIRSEKWKSADKIFGIRPFLRHFFNRYYIVYCERIFE